MLGCRVVIIMHYLLKLGKKIDKVIIIEDWEGFGMKQIFSSGNITIKCVIYNLYE